MSSVIATIVGSFISGIGTGAVQWFLKRSPPRGWRSWKWILGVSLAVAVALALVFRVLCTIRERECRDYYHTYSTLFAERTGAYAGANLDALFTSAIEALNINELEQAVVTRSTADMSALIKDRIEANKGALRALILEHFNGYAMIGLRAAANEPTYPWWMSRALLEWTNSENHASLLVEDTVSAITEDSALLAKSAQAFLRRGDDVGPWKEYSERLLRLVDRKVKSSLARGEDEIAALVCQECPR